MKILLVEYDLAIRKAVERFLRAYLGDSLKLELACNTIEALGKDVWGPDLVITDWHMATQGEGAVVVEHYKNLPEPVPVIVMSGDCVCGQAIAIGASRYLSKPFNPEELATAILELTT